mmetsp:Transcript_23914/g.40772  ORF Transcript_23914/g.40772 Transcript_23914/m.40772 type:complete len:202 (-) Transcript_23914:1008-1613(-)
MTLSNPLRISLVVAATLQSASCFVLQHSSGARQTQLYANNRRDFVRTVVAGSSAMLIPSIANAKGGDSASIAMPNYIEFLIEKNKVIDPNDMLYKGPDIEVQLKRIGEAGARLPEVAALAEEKKWSQVQGIITGPLGTLLQTNYNVASIAGTKEAAAAAKTVKQDLNDINAASQRKDSALCIKAAGKAAADLEKFVKIAFK